MKSGISLLNAKAKSTLGNDSDARMVLKIYYKEMWTDLIEALIGAK
jgi:hypothetical protein